MSKKVNVYTKGESKVTLDKADSGEGLHELTLEELVERLEGLYGESKVKVVNLGNKDSIVYVIGSENAKRFTYKGRDEHYKFNKDIGESDNVEEMMDKCKNKYRKGVDILNGRAELFEPYRVMHNDPRTRDKRKFKNVSRIGGCRDGIGYSVPPESPYLSLERTISDAELYLKESDSDGCVEVFNHNNGERTVYVLGYNRAKRLLNSGGVDLYEFKRNFKDGDDIEKMMRECGVGEDG